MHDDIFWFDVSVDDIMEMKLIHPLAYLSHELGYFFLRHALIFLELLK